MKSKQTFTDPRDGKAYKTVKIGEQVWMAQNLNFDCPGSKCYGNDPKNAEKYGRLYNWETAMEVSPPGWHLPSKEEWQTLVDFAGGDKVAGRKLKAESGWNGTDEFGFSALPGGGGTLDRHSEDYFIGVDEYGLWWSSSEHEHCDFAYFLNMYYKYEVAYLYRFPKPLLLSVRCVKEESK